MRSSLAVRLWLPLMVVLPQLVLAAEDTAAQVEKNLEGEATSLFGGLLRDELKAGPFKITVGPQQDGHFGAILTGAGSSNVDWLNSRPPTPAQFASGKSLVLRYGLLEFSADGNWSSAPDALNQTSLSLKPEVTFSFLDGGQWTAAVKARTNQEKCDLLAAEFSKRTANTTPTAEQIEKIKELSIDKLDDASLLGMFQDVQQLNCNTLGEARPPRQRIALGVYPDVRYRFGRFALNGAIYDANQLILGGGLRLFAPSATISPVFREAPRISASYYTVHESEDSTVPVPDDIKKDYLQVEARMLLRVPFPGYPISQTPVQLDFAPSASKITSGGAKWKMLWKAQLTLASDQQFLPAITYQSGTEQGLKYDTQVILGFLWQLVQPKTKT